MPENCSSYLWSATIKVRHIAFVASSESPTASRVRPAHSSNRTNHFLFCSISSSTLCRTKCGNGRSCASHLSNGEANDRQSVTCIMQRDFDDCRSSSLTKPARSFRVLLKGQHSRPALKSGHQDGRGELLAQVHNAAVTRQLDVLPRAL